MFRTGLGLALVRLFRRPVAEPTDLGVWIDPAPEATPEPDVEPVATVEPIWPAPPGTEEPAPEAGDTGDLIGPFGLAQEGVWGAVLPLRFQRFEGDSATWPSRSRLSLLEDGVAMPGPRHAEFAEIVVTPGAYIHWGEGVYFAGSDGADPNESGRRYSVRLEAASPRVIGFGSCHTGLLMRSAARRNWSNHVNHGGLTYNTEDTLQLIRQMRGELTLPPHLGAFLASAPDLAEAGALDDLAGALVEISNRLIIRYDGWSLNRVAISDHIVKPCAAISPELLSTAIRWFDHGINRSQEETRAATAAVLLEHLPETTDHEALARDIVRDARGEEQSAETIEAGVRMILDRLAAPTALMLHTLRYMPDGRPLRWPAGFHRLLREIADRAGVPVLDPAAQVEARGPEQTLAEDLEHYSSGFIDDLAAEAFALLGLRKPTSDLAGED